MMPTREEILRALNTVKDPELEISILDHQLVSEIDIREEGRRVLIRLAFQRKMPGCPGCVPIVWLIQRRIVREVKETVGKLPGVNEVEVLIN
ncbi:MAG: iron-sulfur cluster assembly protein [Deltaproteobacteria bacterium]|nr:iron-sulfur cluster assembly protein [Deltaproteobacteria bacterium]